MPVTFSGNLITLDDRSGRHHPRTRTVTTAGGADVAPHPHSPRPGGPPARSVRRERPGRDVPDPRRTTTIRFWHGGVPRARSGRSAAPSPRSSGRTPTPASRSSRAGARTRSKPRCGSRAGPAPPTSSPRSAPATSAGTARSASPTSPARNPIRRPDPPGPTPGWTGRSPGPGPPRTANGPRGSPGRGRPAGSLGSPGPRGVPHPAVRRVPALPAAREPLGAVERESCGGSVVSAAFRGPRFLKIARMPVWMSVPAAILHG